MPNSIFNRVIWYNQGMRILFRLLLIIVLFSFALPLYASAEVGIGVGQTLQYAWMDASDPIPISGRSLSLEVEIPLYTTKLIGFSLSWNTVGEAWVTPLTLLRGYDAVGLGCKVLFPLLKGRAASLFVGPSVGLWYGLYTRTPLAFAYAEAGCILEGELDIVRLFKKEAPTLALRVQIPWNVVFRKDIQFQTSLAARVVLLAGVW